MRVAFDLDDTLVPSTREFSVGSEKLKFPFSTFYREAIRIGAIALLKEIGFKHELWVYTTSLRTEFYVKSWLKLWGVTIHQVINQTEHQKTVSGSNLYSRFSKVPSLYSIDLMIDDSPGVAIECKEQGCKCLIINPQDDDWVNKVKGIVLK